MSSPVTLLTLVALVAITLTGWITYIGERSYYTERRAFNWSPSKRTTIYPLDYREWTKHINVAKGCIRYRTYPPGVKVSIKYRESSGHYVYYDKWCTKGDCPNFVTMSVAKPARLYVERFHGADNPICRSIYEGNSPWNASDMPDKRDLLAGGIVDRNMYESNNKRTKEMPSGYQRWSTKLLPREEVLIRLRPTRDCALIVKNKTISQESSNFAVWTPKLNKWKYGDEHCVNNSADARLATASLSGVGVVVWRKPAGECKCQ